MSRKGDATRGRPISYDKEAVMENMVEKSHLLRDDNGTVWPPKSDIWGLLVKPFAATMTTRALYQFVKTNYSIIFALDGGEIVENKLPNDLGEGMFDDEITDEEVEEDENDWDNNKENLRTESFQIILNYEKWEKIKPVDKIYMRKLEANRRNNTRKYKVLKPG